MSLCLDGRVVVITGASRGLGRASAEYLASHGASLGLLARNEEALAEVAELLPTEALAIGCDVTEAAQVTTAFRKVADRFGGIDAVVANAGGQSAARRAEDLPIEEWHKMVATNLTGAYFTARAAYDYLSQSRAARMIFISSAVAMGPLDRMCAYVAAKAGVEGLVRALSVEWAQNGICVNAIAPGLIDNSGAEDLPKNVRDRIINKTVLRRPGGVSDVVNTILFLAGDSSEYITGQVLSVDGGYGLG